MVVIYYYCSIMTVNNFNEHCVILSIPLITKIEDSSNPQRVLLFIDLTDDVHSVICKKLTEKLIFDGIITEYPAIWINNTYNNSLIILETTEGLVQSGITDIKDIVHGTMFVRKYTVSIKCNISNEITLNEITLLSY